jgi:hypothetical protein
MYTKKNIYTSMTYLKVKKDIYAIGIANMIAWNFRNPINFLKKYNKLINNVKNTLKAFLMTNGIKFRGVPK